MWVEEEEHGIFSAPVDSSITLRTRIPSLPRPKLLSNWDVQAVLLRGGVFLLFTEMIGDLSEWNRGDCIRSPLAVYKVSVIREMNQ